MLKSGNVQNNRRIAKNSLFMSIRMVIVLLITLYTSRVILKILGVEDYGIYNVVCGFVSMFAFLNTSLTNGIQRFYNVELGRNKEEGANRVYNTALVIQLILAVIIILPAEIIGVWYLHNKMVIPSNRMFAAEWIFQLSLLTFIAEIMQVPFSASVIAHERMDFFAFVSVLKAVFNLCAISIVAYISYDGLVVYGVLLTMASIVSLILYICYCKYHFPEIYITKNFDKSLFRQMLSFSGWNCFGSFSGMMKEQGINLVLNLFFGPVVNAARGIAFQVRSGIQSFVTNITVPVRPQVIQSYAIGDIQRSMRLMYSVSKLSCYFLFMLAIPVVLEVDYVLHLWLGNNVPEHTPVFVVIVLLTAFGSNLNGALSNVVHASGKMRNYQVLSSFVKIMSVPVSYFLFLYFSIPELSMLMVLVFDLLAHFTGLIVFRNIVNGFTVLDYGKRVVLPILTVMLVGVIIPSGMHYYLEEGFCRLFIVTCSSIIWGSVCIYIIGLTESERAFVKQLLNKLYIKVPKYHGQDRGVKA